MQRLLFISFLTCALFSSAQHKVDLTIEPSTAEVGETFEVTITSTVAGPIDFSNVPSEFIQDYAVRQGSTHQSGPGGKPSTAYYYTISGIIKQQGNYTFGPVTVSNGNKTYVSNTAVINISPRVQMSAGVVSSKQFRDPAFGVIEVNKRTLYEGEPLLVRSKVYARYKPTHIQNYAPYDINGTVVKYPIGNASAFKSTIERYRGEEFYAIEHDKNVLFPNGIGKVSIEPFKMNLHQGYQSFPLESSSVKITVQPLPLNPPNDFIGAVGDFSVTREIPEKKFDQGDVIKMIVTITGQGNLHNITVPQLNLPKGFTIYGDPVIDENYSMGVRGSEGKITYEFNVEVITSGVMDVPPMSITYFDPQQEKYVQVITESDTLNVKANNNFKKLVADSEKNERVEELVVQEFNPRNDEGSIAPNNIYGSGIFWGGVSVPLASAFLFLLFAKGRENNEERIAARAIRNKRSSAITENFASTKKAVASPDSSLFYTSLEKTLRSSFLASMKLEEDKVLNKQEMIDHARSINESLGMQVSSLFEKCEIARYSYGLGIDSRPEHLKELESILQQLNKRK